MIGLLLAYQYNKGAWPGVIGVVMKSTGAYHLPVLLVLLEMGLFVCAEKPFLFKKHSVFPYEKAKTDKIDAIRLANDGIGYWFRLVAYHIPDKTYEELKSWGGNIITTQSCMS